MSVECFDISSSTLYGVTNPVTEVTKLVTHEESLTVTVGEERGERRFIFLHQASATTLMAIIAVVLFAKRSTAGLLSLLFSGSVTKEFPHELFDWLHFEPTWLCACRVVNGPPADQRGRETRPPGGAGSMLR